MMMTIQEAVLRGLFFCGTIFFMFGVVYPAFMAARWVLFYKHRISFKKYMKYI